MVSVKHEPNATLTLSEEEAFALLTMCLTSSLRLDVTSEKALKKLADFCKHEQYFAEPVRPSEES